MSLASGLLPRFNPLQLLFPSLCLICGAAVDADEAVCGPCRLTPEPTSLGQWRAQTVVSAALDEVWTAFWFDEAMRAMIHHFKYGGYRRLGPPLAGMALEQVGDLLRPERFNCLVPVPLHPVKRRARGYNQAAVLADALSGLTGLPVAGRWLLRRDWTRSQTGLSIPERQANVTDCFQVIRPGAGEDILLVDDMITTGATASACAQVLREAGYGRIAVLTLATSRKEE